MTPTSFRQSEPAVAVGGTLGAAGVLLAAVLALVQSFGVTLTPEQVTAILGVWSALAGLVAAFTTRRLVRPAGKSVSLGTPELVAAAIEQHETLTPAESMSAGVLPPHLEG